MQISKPIAGVFAIDKPPGFTSFDVVAKLRGMLRMKRIGHGGTLDPLATGVLPIFLGKATLAVGLLSDDTKCYTATARFGIKTDTGDITGDIQEESDVLPDERSLTDALTTFIGNGSQIPPMYSAVKVDGKRLYEIARKKQEIDRKPRSIEVYSLKLLGYDKISKEFNIDVSCTKGTYVRTLVEDIASSLGAVSTLTSLRRTRSGSFTDKDCTTFEEIERQLSIGQLAFIEPIETLFRTLSKVTLSKKQFQSFLNGIPLPLELTEKEAVGVFYEGEMIAVARIQDGFLRQLKRFI